MAVHDRVVRVAKLNHLPLTAVGFDLARDFEFFRVKGHFGLKTVTIWQSCIGTIKM